ncbi:hypothetical protein KA005_47830, partial [bacterium]|nr:hypothetical protein [bacterium]
DAAFYLINAPVVDLENKKEIIHSKKMAFALQFFDAFILYEKLYCDPTVPFPFVESKLSRLWKKEDHTFNIRTYKETLFEEDQLSFYKELSGVVAPLRIDDNKIDSLLKDSIQFLEVILENTPLEKIHEDLRNAISSVLPADTIKWINQERKAGREYSFPMIYEPAYIIESSFFLENTARFMKKFVESEKLIKDPLIQENLFLKSLYREPLIAWIFSTILCSSLQQYLDLPGVYSTMSFPSLKLFPSIIDKIKKSDLAKKVLTGMKEIYDYGPGRELKISVPSFSAWVGDFRGKSNLEILKVALDIRENKYVSQFRSKLWKVVDDIIRDTDMSGDIKASQKALDKNMRELYKELRGGLPQTWKQRIGETVITALLSAPLSFLTGLITNIVSESFKTYRDNKKNGWIYFLHKQIGYI